MSSKTAEHNQLCWECQRRERVCDGARPFCNSCVAAGIVCPGYGNHRPLTWLTPGKVTVHSTRKLNRDSSSSKTTKKTPKRKAKSSVEKIPEPHSAAQVGDPASRSKGLVGGDAAARHRPEDTRRSNLRQREPITQQMQSLVVTRRMGTRQTGHFFNIPADLKPHEWNVIESVQFYNTYVVPGSRSSEIVTNHFTLRELKYEDISSWGPSTHLWITSVALIHRAAIVSQNQGFILDPQRSGPAKELWPTLYCFKEHAILAIKHHIASGNFDDDVIFDIVHTLFGVELATSTSLSWLAHMQGFITLINLRGGLRHLMETSGILKYILLDFIICAVIANTTSPSDQISSEVTDFPIQDVEDLYKISLNMYFACPPYLFSDILRITRLREQVATGSPIEGGESVQEAAQKIFAHIEAFKPEPWMRHFGLPDVRECRLIGDTYQAAVALYWILSLPHDKDNSRHEYLKLFYKTCLFALLEQGMKYPLFRKPMRWPIVVAGIAAARGTWAEQDLVEKYWDESKIWAGVGIGLITTKAMLRKFWASGKTDWDDCFDKPCHVLY